MTDELDRLKAALLAHTPEPNPDAKARAIAMAQKSFAARQGTADVARPTTNRPENQVGVVERIKHMFANIGLRPILLTTSSLAVVGLGAILVLPNGLEFPNSGFVEPQNVTLKKENTEGLGALSEPMLAPLAMEEADMAMELSLAEPVLGLLARSSTDELIIRPTDNNEQFANEAANPLKIANEDPISTFSIDVDTASYAFVRSAIQNGTLPQPDAVRIEEMVNYFPYSYPAPANDVPFSTSVSVFRTPWNSDTKLIQIGIQGEKAAVENRPPLDLVFLIDTSGSMRNANKLPLLKQSFRLLLSKLTSQDKVSIVTYAGSSGVVLAPTSADNKSTIMAALERLEAGGSTSGQAGLQLAYAQAEEMSGEDRVGRILLATDGDFNVGISDPEALKAYIADKRESGTYLSVLGFGRGNYNDALMQAIAQNGNGTASYIDTLSEAQKVLVDQVGGALFPIANDVKIQVEFNPSQIAEYRLIGYETRILEREDFNNDKVDAGDIGAGHSVTAIYEVTLVGSPAIMSDPLRYVTNPEAASSDELGFLKLRYKAPGQSESQLITTPIEDGENPNNEALFAAAIASFGQLLRNGKYLGEWTYTDAIALAVSTKGEDAFGYRHEAISLMRLADTLSQ
ncbi:MAG: Ca-activated chloride channel family protein [Paracoccaceae bacterium]|jgi:Ca-activated chloride channel family protein